MDAYGTNTRAGAVTKEFESLDLEKLGKKVVRLSSMMTRCQTGKAGHWGWGNDSKSPLKPTENLLKCRMRMHNRHNSNKQKNKTNDKALLLLVMVEKQVGWQLKQWKKHADNSPTIETYHRHAISHSCAFCVALCWLKRCFWWHYAHMFDQIFLFIFSARWILWCNIQFLIFFKQRLSYFSLTSRTCFLVWRSSALR